MAIVMKQLNRADEATEAITSFRHLCPLQTQESLDNILIDLYKVNSFSFFHYTSQVLDATGTEPWWDKVARFCIRYNLFRIFIKILTFAHLSFIINFFVSPLY